jgi:hypothetical protein
MIAALIPAVAAACPACAGRSGGGTAATVILGAMILFPFAVTSAVIFAIRRDQQLSERDQET